ncbi:MAG: hypothetical protein ACRDP6_16505 [Actinoallomurus sp.]
MPTPAVEGLLVEPYVTVPEFRAAPTWIDSDDLIPGGTSTKQDDELFNVLLRASAQVDTTVMQRLGGHTAVEQLRARTDRRGVLSIHPSNNPVRAVTALSYGADPTSLVLLTDLTGVWIEDARQVLVSAPTRGSWAGFLEFGPATPAGATAFVRLTYTAGYGSATLTATANTGASTLAVSAPAGIMPGDVLRIWDPGFEEAVTVAPGYVPGATTVPIVSPLTQTHAAGAGISALPADIHQAVICFTVALLLREDASSDAPFAGAPFGPAARRSSAGGKAGGLLDEAERLLAPYRRIR